MEATFNINISDYMSTSEIAEMVHDEIQYQIRDKVDKALKCVSVSDIISNTASKVAIRLLEEQDVDLHQKIADNVLRCIDDLSRWDVFRDSEEFGKTKGKVVLDECVEEARPKIQQKVDGIIEDKLNADWLIDEVVDAFYGKLRDQLIR